MEVGRREALPDLDWERLRSAIAVVVLRRVPRHAVEDLVQDVLLALWTAQRARRPAAPMSRVRSIARNKCNDWHRRRAREASVFAPSPSSHELASHTQVPTEGPPDLANLRRDTPSGHRLVATFDLPPHRQREFVLASLDRLPPRQRRVARAIFSGLRATRAIARAARIHPSDCREVIAALPGAIRRILPLVPPPGRLGVRSRAGRSGSTRIPLPPPGPDLMKTLAALVSIFVIALVTLGAMRLQESNTCDNTLACGAWVESSGSFSANGPEEPGRCHCAQVGSNQLCLTQECKLSKKVFVQLQSGQQSFRHLQPGTCFNASNPQTTAIAVDVNACGGSSTASFHVFASTDCSGTPTLWYYIGHCTASTCASKTCAQSPQ